MMSVFAGSTLSDMLDSIEERVSDKKMTPDEKTDIKLPTSVKFPTSCSTTPTATAPRRSPLPATGSNSAPRARRTLARRR
ncbi:MAG: hypothetical protein ACLR8Y_18695 [Alistipes indistinctus]